MLLKKKNGFTLVELLVVMSIIGLLAAVLITQVSKMQETARAMKCKANLRNLGQAALNYGVDHGQLPWAASHEASEANRTSGGFRSYVYLRRGWVDWTTQAGDVETWPKNFTPGDVSFSANGRMVSTFDGKPGFMSITNGVLWGYMGRELSTYVCEAHRSKAKSQTANQIYRSYFMNSYFGYNKDFTPLVPGSKYRDIYLNNLSSRGNAATLLLFAELPVKQSGVDAKRAVDGILETIIVGYNDGKDTKSAPLQEIVGFNHLVGKRSVAHVVFADGHVDVLHSSATVTDVTYYKKWAGYLCNGVDLPKNSSQWTMPPVVP